MQVAIQDLSPAQINYLFAVINQHDWRYPWLLEKEGYHSWINSEVAWGRSHPDMYAPNAVLAMLETLRPTLVGDSQGTGWHASVPGGARTAYGASVAEAVLKVYLYHKLGPKADLPDAMKDI